VQRANDGEVESLSDGGQQFDIAFLHLFHGGVDRYAVVHDRGCLLRESIDFHAAGARLVVYQERSTNGPTRE
jgi:hypothetical protein